MKQPGSGEPSIADPVEVPGPRAGKQMALVGRRDERKALDRLLDGARSGRSGVLVLRGEAGVGKTALLEYLAERASGCELARAAGVQADTELAFAGLQQMFASLLGPLESLPDPQHEALAVAFGLRRGPAPDRFLVGLAVLGLLAEIAEARPVVCVVDDAQWLDRVSAQTLAFVARRLLGESVVLVFAVREPSQDQTLAGLPELVVRGLSDEDARRVLAPVIRGRLDERVIDRIVAETRGNPLALLELPHRLSAGELAGGLERSARRAQSRGGMAAAAGFLERAAALTPDPAGRARRALAAARAHQLGGAPEAASALLDTASSGLLDELDQAMLEQLRGRVALHLSRSGEAAALLLDAARRLAALDPGLARDTHLESLYAATVAGRLGG